jgi:diguanylate cyclase (GGDEF)-like protein
VRSFRAILLGALLLLQAGMVTAIVLVTRASDDSVLTDHMRLIISRVADASVQNTDGFLAAGPEEADLTRRLIQQGVLPLDPTPNGDVERYLFNQLQVHHQLDGMYLGYPDGRFLYVSRDDSKSPTDGPAAGQHGFRTKSIAVVPADGAARTSLVWHTDSFNELARDTDPTDTYDPRTRPWYEQARTTDGPIQTDPYVFFTSQQPGVTVAERITAPDGQLQAVVGIDIQLSELSTFLRQLDVSPHGTAFIVDRSGQLVADRDPAAMRGLPATDAATGTTGTDLRRPKTDEVSDPSVAAAYQAFPTAVEGEGGLRTASFKIGGQPAQTVFAPLSQAQWYVGVAAPESDFLGDIRSNQRTNVLLVITIGLASVMLAVPLIRFVAARLQRGEEEATTDALTGLANRRALDARLPDLIRHSVAKSRPLSVAVLDIDKFKTINDTYGHAVGDEALVAVGRRLQASVRDQDLVCRQGGDEFAVIILDADEQLATEIIERARASLSDQPTNTTAGPVRVNITAGVAGMGETRSADAEALLAAADAALYEAKEGGRNQVRSASELASAPSKPTG